MILTWRNHDRSVFQNAGSVGSASTGVTTGNMRKHRHGEIGGALRAEDPAWAQRALRTPNRSYEFAATNCCQFMTEINSTRGLIQIVRLQRR
jgi:hypothetical protein